MSEYVPTTDDVMRGFTAPGYKLAPQLKGESYSTFLSRMSMSVMTSQTESEAAFRRWLEAHERQVAAKALRDAAERYNAETDPESVSWNPLTAGSGDFEGILLRYAALVSEPSTPEGENCG